MVSLDLSCAGVRFCTLTPFTSAFTVIGDTPTTFAIARWLASIFLSFEWTARMWRTTLGSIDPCSGNTDLPGGGFGGFASEIARSARWTSTLACTWISRRFRIAAAAWYAFAWSFLRSRRSVPPQPYTVP